VSLQHFATSPKNNIFLLQSKIKKKYLKTKRGKKKKSKPREHLTVGHPSGGSAPLGDGTQRFGQFLMGSS
jgi:hypothetical protein